MATIGRVVIDIDANMAKFVKKMEKSARQMDSFGKRATRAAKTLNRTFAVAGVAVSARALTGLASSVVDAGISMENFERTLKAATGSAQAAKNELNFVIKTSKDLGLNLETTADSYAKLTAAARGTSLEGAAARQIFLAVSESATVLGLSADQARGALTAIEQMISKGNVSAEELRGQLGERLPGAFQMAARSIGVTTQELDKMLKKGELTAAELLPALAKELRSTFGPEVAAAADSAGAAFNRFNTSIFELKASLAEGGLLDALTAAANKFAAFVSPSLTNQISEVTQKIAAQKAEIEKGSVFLPTGAAEKNLERLENQLNDLLFKQGEFVESQFSVSAGVSGTTTEFVRQNAALEAFKRQYETAEQEVARLREQLAGFKGELDPAEFNRINDEIGEILTGGLEEIVITAEKRFSKPMQKQLKDLSEFSRQAARNMQDDFADFLFDPFEEGLDGMLKAFLDTMRRMVAQAAAAQIFNALFGGTGGLGKALGGFLGIGSGKVPGSTPPILPEFAGGGSFTVPGFGGTDSQFVPFFATPGERVTVSRPGQQAGGNTVIINNSIEVNGADPAHTAELLAPLLEENKLETIAQIQDMRVRRQF